VEVGPGTTPAISWTPSCRLFLVLVARAPSGGDQEWLVIADGANVIGPPLTYGTTPAGSRVAIDPSPLSGGTAYEVYLYRWVGPGAQTGAFVGTAPFTP
jgi:hypothetical protein